MSAETFFEEWNTLACESCGGGNSRIRTFVQNSRAKLKPSHSQQGARTDVQRFG
jgi:hypothetical protein